MTLINIIAGAIYTKGFKAKDKIQIYGMALLFLVVLYNSPSGLVVYWTMNNVFSLVKNIFYKIKNPLKVLYILMAAFVLFLDFYVLFIHEGLMHKRILLFVVATALLFTPFVVKAVNRLLDTVLQPLVTDKTLVCFRDLSFPRISSNRPSWNFRALTATVLRLFSCSRLRCKCWACWCSGRLVYIFCSMPAFRHSSQARLLCCFFPAW